MCLCVCEASFICCLRRCFCIFDMDVLSSIHCRFSVLVQSLWYNLRFRHGYKRDCFVFVCRILCLSTLRQNTHLLWAVPAASSACVCRVAARLNPLAVYWRVNLSGEWETLVTTSFCYISPLEECTNIIGRCSYAAPANKNCKLQPCVSTRFGIPRK